MIKMCLCERCRSTSTEEIIVGRKISMLEVTCETVNEILEIKMAKELYKSTLCHLFFFSE